jgi:Flp pilus assembly protein TadD
LNESVEVLKKKAHDLVQKGKLDSALRAFTLILESDPRDASVHNKVGDILLKTHSEAAALEHFLKSAELYYEEGLHMVALSVCRKILRASETIPRVYYLMGKCLQAQDKGDQAKREYVRYLSTEADGNDDSKAEVLRALTILDPAED